MGSKARPKRYRAITVEWVDACSVYGWREDNTYSAFAGGGVSILTRGYLVAQDAHSISVAQNIGREVLEGSRSLADVIQIPRAWITRKRIERCPWVRK